MNHPYWSTIFAIKAVHSMKWYSFRSKHQQPGPLKYDNLFSCTLRCKYRVARNRDSWLLFISEVRLCANLQNYRRIWCHNASTSCSSDVTPVSDVIFWPHPDRYIGVPSQYKDSLSKSGIFVKNIRRSCDGLVFIMGIPVFMMIKTTSLYWDDPWHALWIYGLYIQFHKSPRWYFVLLWGSSIIQRPHSQHITYYVRFRLCSVYINRCRNAVCLVLKQSVIWTRKKSEIMSLTVIKLHVMK